MVLSHSQPVNTTAREETIGLEEGGTTEAVNRGAGIRTIQWYFILKVY